MNASYEEKQKNERDSDTVNMGGHRVPVWLIWLVVLVIIVWVVVKYNVYEHITLPKNLVNTPLIGGESPINVRGMIGGNSASYMD
jgi:hypothetical protein